MKKRTDRWRDKRGYNNRQAESVSSITQLTQTSWSLEYY